MPGLNASTFPNPSLNSTNSDKKIPESNVAGSSSPFMCMAVAIHNFRPDSQLESRALSLNTGDFVYVLEQHESGWWDAVVSRPTGALRGWVPSNFLRVQESYSPTDDVHVSVSGHSSPMEKQIEPEKPLPKDSSASKPSPAIESNNSTELSIAVASSLHSSSEENNSSCQPLRSPNSEIPPSRLPDTSGALLETKTEKWQRRLTSNGKEYFVNLETDKTTWSHPNVESQEKKTQADANAISSPIPSAVSKSESITSEELQSVSILDASPNQNSANPTISVEASIKAFFPAKAREASSIANAISKASYAAPTWEFLIVQILSAAAALSRAAKANESARIIPLTNTVLDTIRKMLLCTGLADRESPLLRVFADLYKAHSLLHSYLTRLVIATIVAGGMWPPPDACDILCRRLGQVLVTLKQLVSAAFSCTPTGIIPVPLVENTHFNHLIVPAIDLHHCMHDSMVLSSLEKSRVTIANSLAQLNCLLAASNEFSNAILDLVKSSVQEIGHCLSLVEDLPMSDNTKKGGIKQVQSAYSRRDSNHLLDFSMRKEIVYNLTNDIITSSRMAAEPFAPPNALESMMHNVTILARSIDDLVISVKMFLDSHISNRQRALQKTLQQSIEDKQTSTPPVDHRPVTLPNRSCHELPTVSSSSLNNLQRRVLSLNHLSAENLTPMSAVSDGENSSSRSISDAKQSYRVSESTKKASSYKNETGSPLSAQSQTSRPHTTSINSLAAKSSASRFSVTSSTIARDHFYYEYAPEEILLKDDKIIGGTFNALVARLTLHDITIDSTFMGAFLLSFRHFSNAETFLEQLIARFTLAAPKDFDNSPDLLNEWNEKKLLPVRLRVINVLKSWIDHYYLPDVDSRVLPAISNFAENIIAPVMPQPAKRILDVVQRRLTASIEQSSEQLFQASVLGPKTNGGARDSVVSAGESSATPSQNSPPSRRVPDARNLSVSISRESTKQVIAAPVVIDYSPIQPKRPINKIICIDPLEFARQLTIFEFKSYNKITGLELFTLCFGVKSNGNSHAPNVKEVINLSNTISRWVTESILYELDVKRRSDVVKHWIKTAHSCLLLKNFNTLRSITCALDSTNISRLKKTWRLLSARKKDLLDEARKATDHSRNFSEYRATLRSTVAPCIPFLGLYLTDLTFINDGNKATRGPDDKLINFDKYIKAYTTVSEYLRFRVPYQLEEIQDVQIFLGRCIDSVFTKNSTPEALYTMSLTIEPREIQTESNAQ